MFGKKKIISQPNSHITSLIGAETKINGDISFTGGLRIEGHVTGNITGLGDNPSTLMLSDGSFVEGKIRVSHAVINGTVVGPIQSDEYLELQSKANISGRISYKNIETQLGATVDGTVHRVVKAEPDTRIVALISPSEARNP